MLSFAYCDNSDLIAVIFSTDYGDYTDDGRAMAAVANSLKHYSRALHRSFIAFIDLV